MENWSMTTIVVLVATTKILLFKFCAIQSLFVLSLIVLETIAGYKTVNASCKWKRCKMEIEIFF